MISYTSATGGLINSDCAQAQAPSESGSLKPGCPQGDEATDVYLDMNKP